MWFFETLIDFLKAVLTTVVICAIGGLIGSFGFYLHKAILYIKFRDLRSAKWPLIYALTGIVSGTAGLIYFQVPWYMGLTLAGVLVAGFFGHFMVPEPFGE